MMGNIDRISEPSEQEYQSKAYLSSKKLPLVDFGHSISGT